MKNLTLILVHYQHFYNANHYQVKVLIMVFFSFISDIFRIIIGTNNIGTDKIKLAKKTLIKE